MLRRSCQAHIKPRKHVLDRLDHPTPTRRHDLLTTQTINRHLICSMRENLRSDIVVWWVSPPFQGQGAWTNMGNRIVLIVIDSAKYVWYDTHLYLFMIWYRRELPLRGTPPVPPHGLSKFSDYLSSYSQTLRVLKHTCTTQIANLCQPFNRSYSQMTFFICYKIPLLSPWKIC